MALGTVIRAITPPGVNPFGIAWDGRTFWHMDNATLYQLDTNGTVLRGGFVAGIGQGGLCWAGSQLWVVNQGGNAVNLIDVTPATPILLRSIASPGATPRGVGWDGAHLWITSFGTQRVYCVDPVSGAALLDWASPAAFPEGIVCIGNGDAFLTTRGTSQIHLVSLRTGTSKAAFATPSTSAFGLTWDGRTLWHCDYNTDLIYQIMVN